MTGAEAQARYRAKHPDRVVAAKRRRAQDPERRAVDTEARRKWCRANPHKAIFASKKAQAAQNGIQFSLVLEDVHFPEYCPVLGIKLCYERAREVRAAREDSPSFDRFNPDGAYSPDNVLIVSHKANRIRKSFTPSELVEKGKQIANLEYFKIARFYSNLTKSLNLNGNHC